MDFMDFTFMQNYNYSVPLIPDLTNHKEMTTLIRESKRGLCNNLGLVASHS